MTGIVDWAGGRARMIIAFIAMSLIIGWTAYSGLPKEGEPDIEIPALFISVPFPGISAEDSESLLVKVMESKLRDLDGLQTMTGTAAEGYAAIALEFEFGWDKTKILADVRDKMGQAEADFPSGFEQYSVNEFNFSQFPILIVALSGDLPERTLLRVAKDLQDTLESLPAVLEAGLAGHRDEMLEVVIDPLALEAYNVTANELINVVTNNNLLIAAGEIETDQGAFAVKIPSSFDDAIDVYNLPIKVNGDRIVTLGELAEIRLTFEDRAGTARFNGSDTVALQVSKRKGFNIIDTSQLIRETIEAEQERWPQELREAIRVDVALDQSKVVDSMVGTLEGSVLTAIALVMIVVLAALGLRSALLVGFAIPTSFLLAFILLGIMGIPISNIVMFGLILAVGMLVDGAIVVVEYADKRLQQGAGPMEAYTDAAKRMFWPIISSTATTLCAFLPMLFWPGVPGEFMGMLPVTLIFVLSASLIVALIYLPVMGGVSGRISRLITNASEGLRGLNIFIRLALAAFGIVLLFVAAMQVLNPGYILPIERGQAGFGLTVATGLFFVFSAMLSSVFLGAITRKREIQSVKTGHRRTAFGHFTKFIAGNPIMPLVAIAAVGAFVAVTFMTFSENNNGVEFFVESETEQAIAYVRARGNLSVVEKDDLTRQVEDVVRSIDGVDAVFAFAGDGGLNTNTGGLSGPNDTIGQVQFELAEWGARRDDTEILDEMQAKLDQIPGVFVEIFSQDRGPAQGKPVNLRLKSDNWEDLHTAAEIALARFEETKGLFAIEDTRPLPGIDWQIDVDVEAAGRYNANVATVGAMVQLVTRGLLLDTMRVDSSDEEIEIRVRLPEDERVLATLDNLKVRTEGGLVPLSNFVSRQPVEKLGQIDRIDQERFFDVKADVLTDLTNEEGAVINSNERIAALTEWIEAENPFPASVTYEWAGDTEEQEESQAFLSQAFLAALGLMFVILLAQFNSFYNATLVLLAVILSTTGVLIGMLVMNQAFSIIMTGTGIVALAGIVVNNNIVLIDTYQEYSRFMPRLEAIVRTAEARIRPVLLTTITTMAGLAPMMFGLSLDFFIGGYTVDSPTSLWWKQLATAVVFGLGIATVLTLIFTPALLALRVWISMGAFASWKRLMALGGRGSKSARDLMLRKEAKRVRDPILLWAEDVAEDTAENTAEDAAEEVTPETPAVEPQPVEEVEAADPVAKPEAATPKEKPKKKARKPRKTKPKDPPLRAAE